MELVSAIIGGAVGWLLALLSQTLFSMTSEDVASINDQVEEITRIEELAVTYWLSDAASDPQEERRMLARLKGALGVTATFEETAKRVFKGRFNDYASLDGRLFDTATGKTFETNDRKMDPETVVELMTICNELRAFLRAQRRRLFWAR